ncbi:MAG: sigma-70 family RNA polymerase sigma factor [Defluviitaleaceae bacterium]|nr:sigma-70 family RNA polymerase sigma factor [Defluviitaleaceae bacterium]
MEIRDIALSPLSNEDLVKNFRNGDKTAPDTLLARFKPLVKARAKAYYVAGGDPEDLIQEGMIGLYKAVLDFDAEKNASFAAFASLCVTRQIQTAIKTADRQKHAPLNESLSLDNEGDDLADSRTGNPEELFLGRESLREAKDFIRKNLSEPERAVLTMHLDGKSYAEIAQTVGKNKKSVDNTLQRIRKKLGLFNIP